MPTNLPSTINIDHFYSAVQRNPNNLDEFQGQSDTQKSSLINQVIEKLSLDDLSELNIQHRVGRTTYNPLQNLLDFLNNNFDKGNIKIQNVKLRKIILKIITKINSEPEVRMYLYQIKACSNLLTKTKISINSNLNIFLELGKFELRLIKSHDLIDLLPHNLKDRECFEELINDYLTFVTEINYNNNSNEVHLIVDQLGEFKRLTQFRDVNHINLEISKFFNRIHKKIEEIGKLEPKFSPGFQSDAFNPVSNTTNTSNNTDFNLYFPLPISNISSPSLPGITNETSANNFFSNNPEYVIGSIIGGIIGGLVLIITGVITFWRWKKSTTPDQTDIEASKNKAIQMKDLPPTNEIKKDFPKKKYNYINEENLKNIRNYSDNLQISLKNFVNSLETSKNNDCSIMEENLNDPTIGERIKNKESVLEKITHLNSYSKVFTLHKLLMEERHKEACEHYEDKKIFEEKMGATANIFKLMQGFYETDLSSESKPLKSSLEVIEGFIRGRANQFDSNTLPLLTEVLDSLNSLLSSLRQPLSRYNTVHAGFQGEEKGEKNGKQQILNNLHKLEAFKTPTSSSSSQPHSSRPLSMSASFFSKSDKQLESTTYSTKKTSLEQKANSDRPNSYESGTSDTSESGQSVYNSNNTLSKTPLIKNNR